MLRSNQPMHILAEYLGFCGVTENAKARCVAKHAPALEIDTEDSFSRRIQNHPQAILAPTQLLFSQLARANRADLGSDHRDHFDELLVLLSGLAKIELQNGDNHLSGHDRHG